MRKEIIVEWLRERARDYSTHAMEVTKRAGGLRTMLAEQLDHDAKHAGELADELERTTFPTDSTSPGERT